MSKTKCARWIVLGFYTEEGTDDGDTWAAVTVDGGTASSACEITLGEEDIELPAHYGVLPAEDAVKLGRFLIKVAGAKKADYIIKEEEA